MASLRARLINFALPLMGIKRFFSQPDKLDERIAKMRRQASPRPGKKAHDSFDISEDAARGFDVVTIAPKGRAKPGAPQLLYLHGGGYVMDIAAVHWSAILGLCERLGAVATVPIYPLAPEHKASETLAAMRDIYDELTEQHGARNVTVMGDSAGGGMALALAQMLKADGDALPGRLVLFSPWLDATGKDPGQQAVQARDKMLSVNGLEACAAMYGGDLANADPRISPLFGELGGLPPMAIFAGTRDLLVSDSRRLVKNLDAIGEKSYEFHEYPDMFHVWMLFPVPEAKQALDQAAAFIRSH